MTDDIPFHEWFYRVWLHTPQARSLSASTREFVWTILAIADPDDRRYSPDRKMCVAAVGYSCTHIATLVGSNYRTIRGRLNKALKLGIVKQIGKVIVLELSIPVALNWSEE